MEPILQRYFIDFKKSYEVNTTSSTNEEENKKKESSAFEMFVNYTVFSVDYPGIFTSDIDLLNFVILVGDTIRVSTELV
jgi:hypothetical protein